MISDVLLVVLSVGLIQWLIALWLKARLEQSIKSEYDKQLAEFKYEIRIREHAKNIADFFSEWALADKADKKKLNNLYREFGKCTTWAPNGPSSNKVLIGIRKYMLKNSAGDLKDTDIVSF